MAEHVEGDRNWRKSSASGGNECVEVDIAADAVRIRHTKDRQGPMLSFTHDEWRAFLAGVHGGEFELPVAQMS